MLARTQMKQKRKQCKHCKSLFQPLSSFHPCCGIPCAIAWGKTKECKAYQDDAMKKEARKAKKEYNESKKSYWEKKLQVLVNRHVLKRDIGKPCISCDKTRIQTARMQGSNFHAGHYKTVGGHPELRFELRNIFKQCAHCNMHNSGNIRGYIAGIIKRKGQAELTWLDGPHEAKNYTIADLKEMIQYYKEQLT